MVTYTVATRQRLREQIIQAIARWEPRVAVVDVAVEPDPENGRLAAVTIIFRLVATQAVARLDLTLQLEG